MELDSAISGWVHGWAHSRRSGWPEPMAGGFSIAVHNAKEATRYVLQDGNPDRIRALAAAVSQELNWIKAPGTEAGLRDCFPEGWQFGPPLFLMGTGLSAVPSELQLLPPGYRLFVEPEANARQVWITDHDGAPAARGRIGIAGGVAVADQIVTETAHRRRGLGRAMMNSLAAEAVAGGCSSAVLMASEAGRGLYSALGWELLSPFVEVCYRSAPSS